MSRAGLIAAMLTLSACATTQNDRMEAQAEAIQERAEAIQELKDAEIDLAVAEGKPLTQEQMARYKEKEAKKAAIAEAFRDYMLYRAASTRYIITR